MKTTISIDSDVRDRLAEVANRHGRTLGEQIEAMVDAAEERLFWDDVSTGYAEYHRSDLIVEVADEYPEYAHLSVGPIPAEGAHNEPWPEVERAATSKAGGGMARNGRRTMA